MLLIAQLSMIMACRDDGLDIPNIPLEGKINGQDWTYSFTSSALYSGSPTKYTFLLLSDEELNSDPCATVSSTKPHLRVVLPLQLGSYSLPMAQPIENLKFVYGNGTEFAATSGFIEILAFDFRRMAGYIQAVSDENNIVEGKFIAELCL